MGGPLAPDYNPEPYVRHKATTERTLFRMHAKSGLPLVTFRPPFVYGPHNPYYREAFFWDRLRAGRPIVIPGDGHRLMQFAYVNDVVRAMIRAMEEPRAVGEAFNMGDPKPLTQVELVEKLRNHRPHRLVRARSGMDHFRLCREAIYNLQARRVSPDFRELFTSIQLNLRRRSLLIFFTSLDDPLLAETFEHEVPLIARRHLVLVNVMRTEGLKPLFQGEVPVDLESAYGALAGQMRWNKMRQLQIALHDRGVRLAVVEPGEIKSQATAAYLWLARVPNASRKAANVGL